MNPSSLLARLRGGADLVLALLALGLVSLLVAPLPPWALDLAVAANLALAATVLVVALFAREALRLASFPVLLLFTTLFRLALEVSATRLVLSRGDAGRVIQAFGQVVVSGSYVVGAVVFCILTLVQLLVVAKGAERVAEVAARFTLDALPGKQMAIDADLRAGSIDAGEARRRRRALEREGQLYGAMDGALKFVKGDALAGVAIVVVNVAGGLVAGLMRGLPLEVAARRYALLAIGDGLAAQIPALLVSVAAAVAVTRVAAEDEGGSLAHELAAQLFGDARPLAAVAALCAGLAAVPGLPAAPFLVLAAAAAGGALRASRCKASAAGTPAAPEPGAGVGAEGPSLVPGGALPQAELLLSARGFGADALARLEGELLPAIAAAVAREVGLPLGPIPVRVGALPEGAWQLLVDEVPAAAGRSPPGEALALAAPEELEAVGIPAVAELDPVSGARVARIAAADVARASALAQVRAPAERVAAAAGAALRANAHLLVGLQEVQGLLERLEATQPALVREVSRQLPTALLAEVLRLLLEEGVSIRPLRQILEALLEAAATTRSPPALAECCRRALRRHIVHDLAPEGALEALLLDPAAEAALRTQAGALDPLAVRALLEMLGAELGARAEPPVVLAAGDVRRALRQLVAPRFPRVAVLSYDELPATLPVRPVGRLALCA